MQSNLDAVEVEAWGRRFGYRCAFRSWGSPQKLTLRLSLRLCMLQCRPRSCCRLGRMVQRAEASIRTAMLHSNEDAHPSDSAQGWSFETAATSCTCAPAAWIQRVFGSLKLEGTRHQGLIWRCQSPVVLSAGAVAHQDADTSDAQLLALRRWNCERINEVLLFWPFRIGFFGTKFARQKPPRTTRTTSCNCQELLGN